MTPFQLAALFLTLVALVGWANVRFAHLPSGVAMVLAGAAIPLVLPLIDRVLGSGGEVLRATSHIDFPETVMGYMLAFLLFAGAAQVDLDELLRRWMPVSTLATLGVVALTVIVGFGAHGAARLLGLELPLPWALAFGALISPTDPIAVLATVKDGGLSPRLKAVLQGEALFNDGVGIVVFTASLAFLGGQAPNPLTAIGHVGVEAMGGLALGWAMGWLALRLMRAIDDYAVEVTLTVALAAGSYALAQALHLSGPIAAVVAGLVIGGPQGQCSMSETTHRYVTGFWTLVDEVLNALLFLMLGLALLLVPFRIEHAGLWAAVIVLVVAARFVVVLPWGAVFDRSGERGAASVMTWGGLHGALSLALALQLPSGPALGMILSTTYAVVLFSIVAQGLTFPRLVRRLNPAQPSQPSQP